MTRPRRSSAASEESNGTAGEQELGSMYDYLAKIILLGPSGTGKSCLLHRFVKNEWRVLSSQTIGVEFASKIIKVGTGSRRKRIKLQLWDTAGTERFRSVSRSYYRGAAGAILVYDVTNHSSFRGLQPFLNDARALASPNLSCLLVGNKLDLASDALIDTSLPPPTPSSVGSMSYFANGSAGSGGTILPSLGTQQKASEAPEGREVSNADANRWASTVGIPVVMEASAFNGENVDEIFARLARMILTKIELGDIDPDDPMSGIQYGDGYGGGWNAGASDGASIKSSMTGATLDEAGGVRRRKGRRNTRSGANWGLRDWEEVFTLTNRRRGGNCC
ncbi:GTP-binding protein ypt4 [Colletotrichum spaethianum]|uniref:GTP-binding protein ypt4 n=1 Tax=Colletotrichum spaethianum TaxID=700344 RepID=A0AA37L6C1_9PEZI|nr:GTP-binding protein ypt4 [Colletotrichum spaethianum]GKT42851.1 GTP-binding protein ypt4 [Colletotrichum spaethianum]